MDDLFQLRLTLDTLGHRVNSVLTENMDLLRAAIEAETKRVCTPEHIQVLVGREMENLLKQMIREKLRIHLRADGVHGVIDDATDRVLSGIFREQEQE